MIGASLARTAAGSSSTAASASPPRMRSPSRDVPSPSFGAGQPIALDHERAAAEQDRRHRGVRDRRRQRSRPLDQQDVRADDRRPQRRAGGQRSDQRFRPGQALGRRVHVEAVALEETDQGLVELARQRDREARRRADRREHRDAGGDRLLHDLVAGPAAHDEDRIARPATRSSSSARPTTLSTALWRPTSSRT